LRRNNSPAQTTTVCVSITYWVVSAYCPTTIYIRNFIRYFVFQYEQASWTSELRRMTWRQQYRCLVRVSTNLYHSGSNVCPCGCPVRVKLYTFPDIRTPSHHHWEVFSNAANTARRFITRKYLPLSYIITDDEVNWSKEERTSLFSAQNCNKTRWFELIETTMLLPQNYRPGNWQ